MKVYTIKQLSCNNYLITIDQECRDSFTSSALPFRLDLWLESPTKNHCKVYTSNPNEIRQILNDYGFIEIDVRWYELTENTLPERINTGQFYNLLHKEKLPSGHIFKVMQARAGELDGYDLNWPIEIKLSDDTGSNFETIARYEIS